jgi:MYXO-CTERM domain-containing protein
MHRSISSLSTVSVVLLANVASGDARAATGGPDAFGYVFVDQADGADYGYIDITATGTNLGTADDTLFPATDLGAPFTFYGEVVDQLAASTNGFLTSAAGVGADFSNDCPLPAVVPGGGPRIAALHDDLVTTVYYQYFDQAAAAAAGYPGETEGISVFQWSGQHASGVANDFIDAEIILFHDDDTILSMVAEDSENGTNSTLGIQNADATIGLGYTCNTAGGVVPGVTAVEYSLSVPGECCVANPDGDPGCDDPVCEAAVCALDDFCCDTEWDAVCANEAVVACPALCDVPSVTINELRVDQPGADDDEYFELFGPPGASLDDLHYLVVGDSGSTTGVIETVIPLAGQVIPPSGYFVAAEGSFALGTADFTTFISLENMDTVTHLLVSGFTGVVGTNIDPNADGVLDSTPWVLVLDAIAIIDPDDVNLPYGPGGACMAGPHCNALSITGDADHVFRCGNGEGVWSQGLFDPLAMPPSDSPGVPNPCACGDGLVVAGEACDDAGESASCDADCTAVGCGDGVLNPTAGEVCDSTIESASCDADCTAAECGDGVVNMAASEECDAMGESASCDADCTAAECGDGVVNMAASEACDAMGESASCDTDCTAAECGDLLVNMTAGETCDVGMRSETCNANCTVASCGDGVLNLAANEECDGDGTGTPGPTANCDGDCTHALCGDMTLNEAAGEECDDGGESKNCDDDCSLAECGDDLTNPAAGEECDDGNTEDGDGCSAGCSVEEEPGSTGDSSSSGAADTVDTGVDETADSSSSSGIAMDSSDGSATISIDDTSSGGETDTVTLTGGVIIPDDDGCNCSAASNGSGRRAVWPMLAVFGLGALRRRRRR